MKKKVMMLGMTALLVNSAFAFEYNLVPGKQILGAYDDITDMSVFQKSCVDYVYTQIGNNIKFYGVRYSADYPPITELSRGEGFIVMTSGSCNVTVPDVTVPDDTGIQFNGFTYHEVHSPITNYTWLDKNLGATKVCSKNREQYQSNQDYIAAEKDCFGDYYQWGRDSSGHEKIINGTTSEIEKNYKSTSNLFVTIANQGENYGDWTYTDNRANRAVEWGKTDGTSICPSGFRVPTESELSKEFRNMTMSSISALNLPNSGTRSIDDGALYAAGIHGALWTKDLDKDYKNYPLYLSFNNHFPNLGTNVNFTSTHASKGMGVRCIKSN